MIRTLGFTACALLALFVHPAVAQIQQSRCADCHFANPDAPGQNHLSEWDHSAHGRPRVGCEVCHGGDPTTFEPFQAHREILPSRNPASPIYRSNLPATCGVCHAGPFVAFQKSRHYALLRNGDREVPTCVTCHGEVAAHLLSPKGVEGRCARCHGAGKRFERAEYAIEARLLLEQVLELRAQLDAARRLIRDVNDQERRGALEEAYGQAEVPLIQAVDAGHAFVFEGLRERLSVARERGAALFGRLLGQDQR